MAKVRVLAKVLFVHNRQFGPDPVEYHRGDIFESDDIEPRALDQLFKTFGLHDHSKTLGRLLELHQREWDEAIRRDPKAKSGMVADWRNPRFIDKNIIPAVEYVSPRVPAAIPRGEKDAAERTIAKLERELAAAKAEIEIESHNQLPPRDAHGRFRKRKEA